MIRNPFYIALWALVLATAPLFAQAPPIDLTPAKDTAVFQNAPVSSILDAYETLSGKHLIRDNSVNDVTFKLNINGAGLNKDQFLTMIQNTLQLNGITMIPLGPDSIKVIVDGGNKMVRAEGIPLITDPKLLPEDDSVVSFYAPLVNITPEEAKKVFTDYAGNHAGYGSYVAASTAQAIIITENSNTVRKLLAIKDLIDVPPAQVATDFIQLRRADATEVAKTLTTLLDQSDQNQSATSNAPVDRTAPVNPAPGTTPQSTTESGNRGPSEKSLTVGTARVYADARSNQILLITRPINLPFLRKIVLELDSPSEYAVPHRRFLSYALASDILPAIEAGVAHDKTELDEAHGTETTQSNSQTQTQQQAQQAQTPNTGSSDSSSPNLSVTPIIPSVEYSAPKVVTIGKTKIMADDRSNSIIVFSTPDVVDRVFSLIDELDRRPIQVYLATVIGQLSISNSSEFGIDLLQKYTHASGFGVAGSSVVSPNTTSSAAVPEPYSLSSAGSFPLLSPGTLGGLTLYGALSSTINAYVRALSSTGHFKVLSCPSVYTTNNKSAYIASGQQVPVPTNTTSGFTGSSTNLTTTASVGYKNVVLSLQIIPLINANHQVTLTIQQTNDTVGSNVSIGGNSVPVVNTQVINTKITVADRSTVVIGGLISNTETVNTSGVPYLQDIPVVGGLFKDKTKSKMRSELVILIQPNVIDSDADQVANDARQAERTTLVGDSRDLLNEKVPTPTPTPTPRPTHISVTTGNSTRYR